MTISIFRKISFLACVCFLASCAISGSSAPATIYLVRHAEKQAGEDPLLTAEGETRAARLGELMVRAKVSKIYSTETRRTEATAKPAADHLGLTINAYDASDLEGFATLLKETGSGRILVVGHSNTTPVLAAYLTGRDEGPWFNEADYESLFRIDFNEAGEAVAYLLSYDSLEKSLED